MLYLLFSIVCSTLIFVIFSAFKRFGVNNVYAIIVNYIIASSLGFIVAKSPKSLAYILERDWFFPAFFVGFLFIVMFQLMALTAQKLGVAKVSVAVKMSVVLPVLAGIYLYKESLEWHKVIAVFLALAAVFLATYKKTEAKSINSKTLFILPVILFLGSGCIDILMKQAQHVWVQPEELALFSAVLFGTAFFWGLLFGVKERLMTKKQPSSKDLLWGVLLGIPNFGSIYFLLNALENSNYPSAVLFPLNNVSIVGLSAVLGYFYFKKSLTKLNVIGIFCGIISIILFAYG